jgi:hypothetical protein
MILPGLNDERKEVDELCRFIEETRIDMIQWRNIALDPEYYLTSIKCVHYTLHYTRLKTMIHSFHSFTPASSS